MPADARPATEPDAGGALRYVEEVEGSVTQQMQADAALMDARALDAQREPFCQDRRQPGGDDPLLGAAYRVLDAVPGGLVALGVVATVITQSSSAGVAAHA